MAAKKATAKKVAKKPAKKASKKIVDRSGEILKRLKVLYPVAICELKLSKKTFKLGLKLKIYEI